MSTATDLINAALVQIGYESLIGEMQDGSRAAQLALAIYGATRDDLLRGSEDWSFARRDVGLTLLKSAPAGGYLLTPWTNDYPPLPWLYEYAYPSDCLKVRSVRPTPIFVPNFDPQPYVFATPNDTATQQKVICCNAPNAICTYAGQVTDPTQFEASFDQALIGALSVRLAPALKDLQTAQAAGTIAAAERNSAAMEQG